ncbi:Adenosylcobalamin biosynthesis, ATP:cob(I)alamin adenosyltransferase-like protein, partial [Haematococcus lacustris]
FRIYTRTGDSGTSCLYTGERLPKDSAYFEALGDVDELNSALGIAREFTEDKDVTVAFQLKTIQSRLIDVGSAIATPATAVQGAKVGRTRFDSAHTSLVESWIDSLDAGLPPLRHFILPSGGKASAFLHAARSICRRAERSVTGAGGVEGPDAMDPAVPVYLNRLSDYLFTAARYMAAKEGHPEVTYQKAA